MVDFQKCLSILLALILMETKQLAHCSISETSESSELLY